MNWVTIVKGFLGGVIGLVLGTIAGGLVVGSIVSRQLPPMPPGGMVGIDVRVYLHSVVFWSIVLVCTLGLSALLTRIGHQTM